MSSSLWMVTKSVQNWDEMDLCTLLPFPPHPTPPPNYDASLHFKGTVKNFSWLLLLLENNNRLENIAIHINWTLTVSAVCATLCSSILNTHTHRRSTWIMLLSEKVWPYNFDFLCMVHDKIYWYYVCGMIALYSFQWLLSNYTMYFFIIIVINFLIWKSRTLYFVWV